MNFCLARPPTLPNDAWAVGFSGSDRIETSAMHWDGANWKSVATPNVGRGHKQVERRAGAGAERRVGGGLFQRQSRLRNRLPR